MKQRNRIFLLGFMGSGKSTLGKQVANDLNYRFVDLDDWIENRTCKSISQIFEEDGEEEFRKLETESLEHLMNEENIVVALGGGTPCFNENMSLINNIGVSVFLDVSESVLVERLLGEQSHRPLLKNKSKEELQDFVSRLLGKRKADYLKADIKVGENGDLLESLKAYLA